MLYRIFAVVAILAGAWLPAIAQSGTNAGPAGLSCSPAPCVLPATQVSPAGGNNINNASIVADPSNPRNIIVGSNDWNCGPNGNESLGFFISLDAGSDWSQYCNPDRSVHGQGYVPGGYPILGYDRNKVAYIGGYYFDETGSGPAVQAVQKSTDGVHWSPPAAAISSNFEPAFCWMTVDTNVGSPYVSSVYISCVLGGWVQGRTYNALVVARSRDGGATWQQASVAPAQTGQDSDWYTAMTVGKNGTVFLTWEYCNTGGPCDNGPAYMVFSKSSDGGMTWSEPTIIASVTLIYPLPNAPGTFVTNTPAIAVDTSDGPYSGSLYVVMYNWTGQFMQVVVARSTDNGNTWSTPVPVAPEVTHDQFFPWISVSPTGLVGVSWLDRRNDPANVNYQAFAGISADGGVSFEPNIQLTSKFSNPNVGGLGNDSNNGAAWDGPNYFLAAWMDQSNGINTQDVVGGIRLK